MTKYCIWLRNCKYLMMTSIGTITYSGISKCLVTDEKAHHIKAKLHCLLSPDHMFSSAFQFCWQITVQSICVPFGISTPIGYVWWFLLEYVVSHICHIHLIFDYVQCGVFPCVFIDLAWQVCRLCSLSPSWCCTLFCLALLKYIIDGSCRDIGLHDFATFFCLTLAYYFDIIIS